MTEPITYDAEGRCARCGSTGYYLDAELCDDDWDPHHHYSVKPCPCNRWRLITNDTPWDVDVLMLYSHGAHQGMVGDSPPGVKLWQPLPEPPEVGT